MYADCKELLDLHPPDLKGVNGWHIYRGIMRLGVIVTSIAVWGFTPRCRDKSEEGEETAYSRVQYATVGYSGLQ